MVTKKELESALETVLILSNEDTVKQINQSEKDIKEGRVKKIGRLKIYPENVD